ncbi:MAG: aminoacyl-tRNA hydrolase [Limnochordales bacterium]|nr:aminoacyl-tRNA hydrolase [Limnochordales bacterium]
MRVVVGLGNPGRRYENTRHSLGFMVVDRLARLLPGSTWQEGEMALVARACFEPANGDGVWLLLVKPLTYMNASGLAVSSLIAAERVTLEQLLVICDDLDLPPGQLRLRARGSAGGHRGLLSIIAAVGSTDFPRLRIGIGRPPEGMSVVDYVLAPLAEEELAVYAAAAEEAARAVLVWATEGIDAAMTQFNRRRPQAQM